MRIVLSSLIILSILSCGKESPVVTDPVISFTLTVTSGVGGSVSSPGGSYTQGKSTSVTATPDPEYVFVNWSNGSTDNPLSITVNSNQTVTANFEKRKYPLTVSITGSGTVSEEIISAGKSTTEYTSGSLIRLTANPLDEWVFIGWSGSVSSTENPIDLTVNESKSIEASFNLIETPSVQVYTNTIIVPTDNESTEDILRTFYDPSGVFSYSSNGSIYTFYPGVGNWSSGQGINTESVNEVSSQILKKEDDVWVFHENDLDASFWGMRNYEILENKVVIGDGNEIGDGQNNLWKGNAFMGEITDNGNILWTKINKPNEMGFFHGTCTGDINGDGLLDAGFTPGINSEGINIFLQNQDGSFYRDDDILNFDEGSSGYPFTIDFADLDNDGLDEIITADYGGGSIPDNNDHEIKIYKYDPTSEKFNIHFQINQPDIYDWGLGATSIKVHDFNNDGINDIAVCREDESRQGFELWKGIGGSKFEIMYSSPVLLFEQIQFREFSVFDANNDGNLDILLRPSHGEWFRSWENGLEIKLNHLIWLNDGSGQFDYYKEKELSFENINVYNLLPYIQNGNLHFVGTWWDENTSTPEITTVDVKVNF